MLITPRVNQCENMWKWWQTCFYKNLAPFVTEDWQTSSLCTAGAWCGPSASANGTRHRRGSSLVLQTINRRSCTTRRRTLLGPSLLALSHLSHYLLAVGLINICLKCETASTRFQPGESSRRGLSVIVQLHQLIVSITNLHSTKVSVLQVLCARWAASAEPSTCASVPAGSAADSHSSSSSDSASATAGTSALRDSVVNVQTFCGF